MEENKQSEDSTEKNKKKLKISAKWFFASVWELIIDTFSVNKGADIEGTIESIKKDVEFKGHNVWILFFSILIACIGLNTNSVAIIIGAMLISPLMGPILGIGYSLGTNDVNTLLNSIKNLIIAVVISVLTSFLYFKLSPFVNEQPEILSRTKPHLLDVLISIFGGLAGIIANSRSERNNVIPGVAIATALMPPLCTAGFGLATHNYDYFFGAFYLFLLNAAGICVTTLIVVKYMKFPIVHYIDPLKEKKVKWFVAIAWIVLIVPSFNMFYKVLNQEFFKRKVDSFIKTELQFEKSYLVKQENEFNGDSISKINLYFYGEIIDSVDMIDLNKKLLTYEIENTTLIFHQDKNNSKEFQDKLENVQTNYDFLFDKTEHEIEFQNAKIADLQEELEKDNLDLELAKLNLEAKILFPSILKIGMSNMNFIENDSSVFMPTFYVKSTEILEKEKIKKWLNYLSHSDTCLVIFEN